MSGAARVRVLDSRSLFQGVRTAPAIDPVFRSANLLRRTVSHLRDDPRVPWNKLNVIERALHADARFVEDMRVDHRRAHIFVPE